MPPLTSKVPGNGTGTLSWTVPGAGLDVSTVYASIDATGAAGPVTAELTIQDQSGVVIARKTQGATVAAGGTGSATWALRLDDEGGTTSGGSLNLVGYTSVDGPTVPIGAGGFDLIPFTNDNGPNSYFTLGTLTNTCLVAGTFGFQIHVEMVDTTAPTAGAIANLQLNRTFGSPAVADQFAIPLRNRFYSNGTLMLPPTPFVVGDKLVASVSNLDAVNAHTFQCTYGFVLCYGLA